MEQESSDGKKAINFNKLENKLRKVLLRGGCAYPVEFIRTLCVTVAIMIAESEDYIVTEEELWNKRNYWVLAQRKHRKKHTELKD